MVIRKKLMIISVLFFVLLLNPASYTPEAVESSKNIEFDKVATREQVNEISLQEEEEDFELGNLRNYDVIEDESYSTIKMNDLWFFLMESNFIEGDYTPSMMNPSAFPSSDEFLKASSLFIQGIDSAIKRIDPSEESIINQHGNEMLTANDIYFNLEEQFYPNYPDRLNLGSLDPGDQKISLAVQSYMLLSAIDVAIYNHPGSIVEIIDDPWYHHAIKIYDFIMNNALTNDALGTGYPAFYSKMTFDSGPRILAVNNTYFAAEDNLVTLLALEAIRPYLNASETISTSVLIAEVQNFLADQLLDTSFDDWGTGFISSINGGSQEATYSLWNQLLYLNFANLRISYFLALPNGSDNDAIVSEVENLVDNSSQIINSLNIFRSTSDLLQSYFNTTNQVLPFISTLHNTMAVEQSLYFASILRDYRLTAYLNNSRAFEGKGITSFAYDLFEKVHSLLWGEEIYSYFGAYDTEFSQKVETPETEEKWSYNRGLANAGALRMYSFIYAYNMAINYTSVIALGDFVDFTITLRWYTLGNSAITRTVVPSFPNTELEMDIPKLDYINYYEIISSLIYDPTSSSSTYVTFSLTAVTDQYPYVDVSGTLQLLLKISRFSSFSIRETSLPITVLGTMDLDMSGSVLAEGEITVVQGITQSISLSLKLVDPETLRAISGANYTIMIMDAQDEVPELQLLQEPTIIEGITSVSGQISETINTSSWIDNKLLEIFIHQDNYIPRWFGMYEIIVKTNNLELNINNPDALKFSAGKESLVINYDIGDKYGSAILTGKITISLVGHGKTQRQSSMPLKGFVRYDDIRWYEAGEYDLIFSITGTGFDDIEIIRTVTITQREFMDELAFYFNYFSNEYGIYATMIGGFLGIIGFFRGSIARMIGRARKCSFCGSTTSSKYNFCSACGNEIGSKKGNKEQTAENVAKDLLKMD
ncbi:MAG: hypothetical protein ACTSYA_01255 [Candidatus Kariarchaeaceae archaeon]